MHDSTDILSISPPPADKRIAYDDGEFHFGDLRLPAAFHEVPQSAAGKFPIVVNIHGGYWRATYGLEHSGQLCAALTALGYATWNLEYRRLGQTGGGYPGTFNDVARGFNHLRELAKQFPLALERIIVIGHSAGGHLALWLTGAHKIPTSSPLSFKSDLKIRAAISLAGVLDLKRGFELGLSRRVIDEFIGGSPEQFPERYAAASPYELIPLAVKQMLFHGKNDASVPYEISRRYFEKAKAAGDEIELLTLPGIGHFELIDPRSAAWKDVTDALTRAMQ